MYLHFVNIHQCQPDENKQYQLDQHDDTALLTLQLHQIPKTILSL